jgi:hypothetical protein
MTLWSCRIASILNGSRTKEGGELLGGQAVEIGQRAFEAGQGPGQRPARPRPIEGLHEVESHHRVDREKPVLLQLAGPERADVAPAVRARAEKRADREAFRREPEAARPGISWTTSAA